VKVALVAQLGNTTGHWVAIHSRRSATRTARLLTCSCGGHEIDRPDEVDFTLNSGACGHIHALYGGNVTVDKRLVGHPPQTSPMYLCQLTMLGKELFHWRWAALALMAS
jgi:hypothetical protein